MGTLPPGRGRRPRGAFARASPAGRRAGPAALRLADRLGASHPTSSADALKRRYPIFPPRRLVLDAWLGELARRGFRRFLAAQGVFQSGLEELGSLMSRGRGTPPIPPRVAAQSCTPAFLRVRGRRIGIRVRPASSAHPGRARHDSSVRAPRGGDPRRTSAPAPASALVRCGAWEKLFSCFLPSIVLLFLPGPALSSLRTFFLQAPARAPRPEPPNIGGAAAPSPPGEPRVAG